MGRRTIQVEVRDNNIGNKLRKLYVEPDDITAKNPIPHFTGSKPEPASVSKRPAGLQLCPHCNGTDKREDGAQCEHCFRGAANPTEYYGLDLDDHPSGDGGIATAAEVLTRRQAEGRHRRRLTHDARDSPVLAALMEQIEEAKRIHAARC